ncbi:MAG: hypothetical protein N3A66_11500, partial [Planctomycetota bacterium]|nr:hypothetical protein [Planctomycetota bacterium]
LWTPERLAFAHDRAHAEAQRLRLEALAGFWRTTDALLAEPGRQAQRAAGRILGSLPNRERQCEKSERQRRSDIYHCRKARIERRDRQRAKACPSRSGAPGRRSGQQWGDIQGRVIIRGKASSFTPRPPYRSCILRPHRITLEAVYQPVKAAQEETPMGKAIGGGERVRFHVAGNEIIVNDSFDPRYQRNAESEFLRTVQTLLEKAEKKPFVLDFSRRPSLPSIMVAMIIETYRRIARAGGVMVLRVRESHYKGLEWAGIGRMFRQTSRTPLPDGDFALEFTSRS